MTDFPDKLTKEFWKRMDKVTAGMLHTDPERVLPMSHYVDVDEGVFCFLTSQGTDAHQAAIERKSTHFVVADQKAHIYARVHGQLSVVEDAAKINELWSPVAAAWFKDGREDPNVRLVCFRPSKAEVWLTDGAAGFLYEIAKANATRSTPDLGDHGVIQF